MASIREANPVQPTQSDSESEYEMIGEDELIEIMGEPGNGTVGSQDFSEVILSDEQKDTGGNDSSVGTDSEESEEKDTATGKDSEECVEEAIELTDNQEKEALEDYPSARERNEDNPSVADEGVVKEAMQSDAATPLPSGAQNQDKEEGKHESEDTRLLNEQSMPNMAKVIKLNTENGILPKCLNEIAVLRSGQQYIKKKAPMCKMIDQLGFSARLSYYDLDIKLQNEGCLMMSDGNFLAKVRILDPELVAQTYGFADAKEILLQQLQIDQVMQDDLMDEKMIQEKSVLKALSCCFKRRKSAVDRIPLTYIVNTADKLDFGELCKMISTYFIHNKLRTKANLFLLAESRCITRSNALARFGYYQLIKNNTDSIGQLKTMLSEFTTTYRERLLKKAPTCLRKTLSNIGIDRITFVQSSDIKLFSDMVEVLGEKIFQKPLADLAARWTHRVRKINIENLLSKEPQTNQIFFYLAKSLENLITEISNRTDHTVEDLLISNHSGWYPINKITWKAENILTECLEREYYFIFKLLKHYDLGSYNQKKPFEYDVKLFNGPRQRTIWEQLVKNTKSLFGYEETTENSLIIANEKRVCYCILDDVLYHVLPAEYRFDTFEQILQGYIDFLNKAHRDQLETLRVITHNMTRFIVQTMTYVVQKDNSSIDGQILHKQLNLIKAKFLLHSLTLNGFGDLVNVFNLYWEKRDFITSIPFIIRHPQMVSLKTALLEIVSVALGKNVSPETTISFFRTYCDLLANLNGVQFDWYVKAFPGASMDLIVNQKLIKLVDNKWANTDNRTYSVVAVEKFAETVPILFDNYTYPKHYVLEILLTMLLFIKNQLQKTRWSSRDRLSEMEQIITTTELLSAVKNSLPFLKEQPDCESFERFFDERIEPFASAVDSSSSHRDFSDRIYSIKVSFWYIQKQSEMDIDQALELFADLNAGFEAEVLRSAYLKYSDSFQQFMKLSCDQYIAKATHIAKKILEITFKKPHQTWNIIDKLEKIPELLAGLAAVWSILASKDVSSTGKYLRPHCIQILCILRMLSVHQWADGVVSHLSRVPTGEGKSLVLGLTAALLALTGHKPRVVCYNRYLVKRDRQDFEHFISMFDLKDSISYSTFEEMANDLVGSIINGERTGLRSSIGRMLLGNRLPKCNARVATDMSKSVLLIDEVDVFFTSEFYGNQYHPVVPVMLPGLDLIQKQIWNIVSLRESKNIDEIIEDIYSYIDSEEMKKQKIFFKFLASERYRRILVYRDKKVDIENYTNKQLFDEHLKKMIECALMVSTLSANSCSNYRLSEQGTILYTQGRKFSNHHNSYYSVFNYFRLRGSNFCTKVGNEINYGCFILNCGLISNAILPTSYPLILGASGTLADLNQYEKQSIEDLYKINEMSLMPTYFGSSKLTFDQSHDFRVSSNFSEWKTEIFARVNSILGAKRSVLVFFECDSLLYSFHDEYCGQFDRLNVLTENTKPELVKQYIDEAGVPKTITLATLGMGRGVDYKSSAAIEKHGGLHVIQTCFSLDVKEEMQIKGRTARKGNRGSYELIVCKEHLDIAGFWGHDLTYGSLHEARLARALKDKQRILKTVDDCQQNHDTTMAYMKMFFKRQS